jgi:hypothetical protein
MQALMPWSLIGRNLRNRPTVFFHLRLIAFSFPEGTAGAPFKEINLNCFFIA